MIYIITFPQFESLVAENLTPKEIQQIKIIKSKMVNDEYAGYSPEEQNKRKQIQDIIGTKKASMVRI